jgi:hypothetical protein
MPDASQPHRRRVGWRQGAGVVVVRSCDDQTRARRGARAPWPATTHYRRREGDGAAHQRANANGRWLNLRRRRHLPRRVQRGAAHVPLSPARHAIAAARKIVAPARRSDANPVHGATPLRGPHPSTSSTPRGGRWNAGRVPISTLSRMARPVAPIVSTPVIPLPAPVVTVPVAAAAPVSSWWRAGAGARA